jgi:hypothetical protein
MAEQDWTPSIVTRSHLQKLMKHGFIPAVEFEACQEPKDPAFTAHAEGYVVSFMTFYEWGFNVPQHQFLCSLLRCYGLELHHPTPSGVLHIASFVTLCEAYLRIDLDLDLWKYFIHIRRKQS